MTKNLIQKIIDKIFKPRAVIVAGPTHVQLIPLNKKGENEKIRKMIIDYLINKYGQKKAKEIIENSDWTVDNKLIPDCSAISVEAKNEKYSCSFLFNGKELEKL
ncbi:hypothetical protein KAT63_01700 [Candidatus Parcubacteria bacterium]|nr:hypothetical protein [Candidatus Parcubacteria bacterium]